MKKYTIATLLLVLTICLAVFGINSLDQAQAAGKYITKVEGTYSSSMSLLKLKATVDLNTVGDVKAKVGSDTYPFSWSSNSYQRSVAGVKSGATVQITAYNFDGKTLETKNYTINNSGEFVEVAPVKTVPVTAVSINLVLKAGSTASFEAIVSPTTATNKLVTWISSDSKIATVDSNGKVKAVKAGVVTITATTKDGAKKANIGVTVK
jgi:uncharacterized protein YjdB